MRGRTRRARGSWHYMGAYGVSASTIGAGFSDFCHCPTVRARWARWRRAGLAAGAWAPRDSERAMASK
jgi:hypothetical protein